ncbi:unnamed protein product [Ascophyllum nodosum]
METCLQEVPLSSYRDGFVRFGSVIQLESAEVGGILVCDPFEETSPGSRLRVATVSPFPPRASSPARAAFKVVAVTDPRLKDLITQMRMAKEGRDALPDVEGSQVRLGDVFHLECDRGLRVCETMSLHRPPLYLASALKTQGFTSRVSNRQAVFFKLGASSGTVWQFQKIVRGKDGGLDRLMSVGQPVRVNSELVVQHRDTRMALSCQSSNVEPTDFGAEFEVSCANITTYGKHLQLEGEQRGTKTAAVAVRAELRANRWVVHQGLRGKGQEDVGINDGVGVDGDGNGYGDDEENVAESVSPGEERTRQLPPEMTAENLLKKARTIAQSCGPASIHRLRNALRSMDPAGGGSKIDREDVRWCLHDIGVILDDEQSQTLFDKFDRGACGLVESEEFLSVLREPLGDRRRSIVEAAFHGFDLNEHGQVSLKLLQRSFDAAAVGRVLNGDAAVSIETQDAMCSGLEAGGASKSGALSLADFERFHQDLCVDAADDRLFEGVIKAAWQGSQ